MAKFTYKQLMSHKDFLKVQARARTLMKDGTDLVAIDYKDRTLYFKTRSATDRRIIWTQKIQITDASLENILSQKTFKNIEDLIKNSGLKLYCSCPAWLYWGFKFVGWRKGYGLEREYRVPRVRNPHQVSSVCKHMYLVLQLYPFWSKSLASKFKKWADSKVEKSKAQSPKGLPEKTLTSKDVSVQMEEEISKEINE